MIYSPRLSLHGESEIERLWRGERERRKYSIHQFIVWPLRLGRLFFMYNQECRRDRTKAPAELMVF